VKGDSATLWPESGFAADSADDTQRIPAPDFLLQRTNDSERLQLWSLELGRGRFRDYLFCPERKTLAHTLNQETQLFEAVSERLAAELAWRQPLPKTVQIGAALDPFHNSAELQKEVIKVVKLLAERRIVSWLVTRGKVDAKVADELAQVRDWIRVSLAVTSYDPEIQSVLEPSAAPIEQRMVSLRQLTKRGILTEVNLEPILPNLTDSREHFEELVEQLAEAGVTSITAGYLVLRPERKEALAAALDTSGWSELVLSAYADAVRLRKGQQAPALLLSKARRQRGYALLMALAANVRIQVRLNARSNPDFGSTPIR